ncbi:uncharacterized protein LOC123546952 [Mercenaria mercenaria]|uniref:uncharacterized protein LOC123546952 n=1 Tax=Mercenaria mercenaria TaxID=6596 RepID=UPI00234F6E5C|nr:uncharacterized protein LOC123546952 [Mercenaria mercenaria]
MASTRETTEIGAKAQRKLLEYKNCGGLLILEEKKYFFQSKKWVQRYFIISKGAKSYCTWNFYCFADQFANKAEWTYSMLEMESVRIYDIESDDVIAFRIVFLDPTIPNLILGCDTNENREIWMNHINEAIEEAHSYSADSGFASGGSVASLRTSRDSKYSKRESHNKYDTIEDADIDNIPEACENRAHHQETKHSTDGGIAGSVKQSKNRQQRNLYNNYENVGIDNTCNFEETSAKFPFSVEATNESQVALRAPADKSSMQEAINKRKGVVVNPNSLTGDTGVVDLSMPASLGRSESFVSVETAFEPSLSQETMSSLHVTAGSSHISSDRNTNAEGYQNRTVYNQRNSSSSSGSDSSFEKPVCFSEDFKPRDYFCEDGQDPNEIMNGMSVGTFFIQGKNKKMKLHVMTPIGAKCFKLFEQNGKVSLYRDFSISPDSVFASLGSFLKHYSVHCLPKDEYKVRLERGYKNFM